MLRSNSYRNRLMSTRWEPVLSYTEKACIASYYRKFSTDIKIKTICLVLLARCSTPRGCWKWLLSYKIFHFNIHGKLSIIRCENKLFFLFLSRQRFQLTWWNWKKWRRQDRNPVIWFCTWQGQVILTANTAWPERGGLARVGHFRVLPKIN